MISGLEEVVREPEYLEPIRYGHKLEMRRRLSRSLIEEISRVKKEPDWMKRLRLSGLLR